MVKAVGQDSLVVVMVSLVLGHLVWLLQSCYVRRVCVS